ncbi:MAG: hypothetical protein LBU64_09365 [Planctomycetota bacterium]|jgi:hypothetical protein|nr:hypothetical protein [Planctomycetota bacterium]
MRIRLPAAIILAILAVNGCADMPVIQPPPGEEQPIGQASIVLGPYLTSGDGMQPFLRFVSNRRCVAGIQLADNRPGGRSHVNRRGSFSLFHSLAIPELEPSRIRNYRLRLDDLDGGAYAVRGLPRLGQTTIVAFAAATGPDLSLAADRLRTLEPDAVVFASPPFPPGREIEPADWENEFFGPLGDKVALGPLWLVPGGDLPAELFPEHAGEGGYWKRDLGVLRLIGMDARAFSFPRSRNAVLARLDRDLDPGHARRAWTVVVLSRAAFDSRVGDGRILTALGDRLELGGVDLVIGAGQRYLRTHPFSIAGAGQTRYISLASGRSPVPASTPREYVAVASDEPQVARLWADEGSLEWRVLDLAGNPIDVLTLDARRPPSEPILSRMEVDADAQAALTLQKEILRIVRQAARAVPDPSHPPLLTLYFANPTTRRFAGELSWSVPPGSGWRLEPPELPFDLLPGQGAAARFAVTPGAASSSPRLTASGQDVGTASDSLVLTPEKRYEVHPAPEAIRLDARFRDKQYWRTLPVLSEFSTPEGIPAANPVEVRITADRIGLILAASLAAKLVSAASPAAGDPEADRDGAVLADESLEIFIDPNRRGRDYYHFAINPRNVILDESSRIGIAYNPVWRHAVRFGRVEAIETWDAEILIPWEALELAGPPPPGSEWGFQLVHRDYSRSREQSQRRRPAAGAAGAPEIGQWVATAGDNSRPGLYGVIRFGDLSAAPAPTGADEGPAPPAPGFLLRGGRLPGRVPGLAPTAPIPEPPPPDLQ